MKIRLMGLPGEVADALTVLRAHLDVVEASGTIPNRGESRQVRVYVEARIPSTDNGRSGT